MYVSVQTFPVSLHRHSSSADSESSVSNGNSLTLQDLIEKVVLLKKAVERERKQFGSSSSETLKSKLRLYASLLASQGSLGTALNYLQQTTSDQVRLVERTCSTCTYVLYMYM